MKKLPIGIQSFEKIRSEDYYYVDKTFFIEKLVKEGSYYFLSRPRRFGKSLFLDTLKQAFLGRKELFKGLYLEDHWDWSKSYPVVHIDFAGGVVKDAPDLENWIIHQLKRNEEELHIKCEDYKDYRACFEELIIRASKEHNQRVVVLIDEYDKPILDRIEEEDEARRIREVLKNFYSVLKPLDRYLKFVFLTGVSKFSKVAIFSGLNQLKDITLSPDYSTICGYTQKEFETTFKDLLEGEDLKEIKLWYNGYSFLGEPLYNPFDILLYLSERIFHPYWFETGTPTFLINLLMKKQYFLPKMEGLKATDRLLSSFDVGHIEPTALLFQTGYLTIKNYEKSPMGVIYHLTYPNKEVKIALHDHLLVYYIGGESEVDFAKIEVREVLKKGDVKEIERILKGLFSSIPYEWYRKNNLSEYEGYYASVVYSFLRGAGLELVAEDYTSKGRIDLTILYDDKAYVMEFKVVESEGQEPKAINQLKEKGYHEKYKDRVKEIYLIGIDFSETLRNIQHFEFEKV
ncbi:MAG: AAA family ATPase [Candidatus Kryptonium sp.]